MAKPQTEKILILIRHAHRDKLDGGSADNGLSTKGRKQARDLKDWFKREYKDAEIAFISSPKKRCQETLEDAAKLFGAKVQTLPFLDEGGMLEAKARKIEDYWLECKEPVLVACSHGDVLPVVLHYLTGARADISKGAVMEIEGSPYGVLLRSLIQNPS